MSEARAVVIANVAPMRAEAVSRSEQTSQAIFGETVRVHEESGEYTRIQTPDSYSGWILSSQLWVMETDERYPNSTRAAMVSSLILPVFREPSGRSERITLLTLGTAVELAEGDAESARSGKFSISFSWNAFWASTVSVLIPKTTALRS